jgi:hypothetical protein
MLPKTKLTSWEIFGLLWLSASIVLLLRLIVGELLAPDASGAASRFAQIPRLSEFFRKRAGECERSGIHGQWKRRASIRQDYLGRFAREFYCRPKSPPNFLKRSCATSSFTKWPISNGAISG